MLRSLFFLLSISLLAPVAGQSFQASCNLVKKKSYCIEYYSEHPSRANINKASCERKGGNLNIAGFCPGKKLVATCLLKRNNSPGRNYQVKTFLYKKGKEKFNASSARSFCDKTAGVSVKYGKSLEYVYKGPEEKQVKPKKKKKRKKKKRKKRRKKKR